MEGHRYDLQAAIYKTALEKHLKLFGIKEGVKEAIYFFLRGGEPFVFVPDAKVCEVMP